jgi:ABC-type multidrug transport system fused ATPase/permease subunit
MFNSIIDKYKVDYKDLNTGYILYNFETITKEFNNVFIDVIQEYIPVSFSLCICLIYLLYLDIKVGLISLCGIIILIVSLFSRSKEGINKSNRQNKLFIKDSEHIQDKVNNLFNIYVSGTEQEEKDSYNDLKDVIQKATFDNHFYLTVTSMIVSVIILLNTLMVFLTIKNYKEGLILVLVVYIKFLEFLGKSSTMLTYSMGILGYAKQSDKFLKEIKSNSIIKQENKDVKLNGPIKFDNINFSYSKEKGSEKLFDNLSLIIKKNEKIAIFGRSGSGKSTLIKLLYGFYKIDKGKITINNINIEDINIDDIRKHMTMATQVVKIFEGTVLENILYGTVQTRASIKIKYGNLLKIFKNLENGLDTKLSVNGSNLSGGQRQIINVLRALGKNTPIVILDEPTVGLDEKTKIDLLSNIKTIKNKIVIIITHDKDVIRYVDKLYELIDGKLKLKTNF